MPKTVYTIWLDELGLHVGVLTDSKDMAYQNQSSTYMYMYVPADCQLFYLVGMWRGFEPIRVTKICFTSRWLMFFESVVRVPKCEFATKMWTCPFLFGFI